MEKAIAWQRACVQTDNILNTFYEFVIGGKKESRTNKM